MKFIEHLKQSDYDEIFPYLSSMDRGKYYSMLCELTDIICEADKKENVVKALERKLDCGEDAIESTFDGNPNSKYGEAWIQSTAKRYGLDENSEGINILRNAIRIYSDKESTAINPKRYKRNYNRYIASEIGMAVECYSPCDCLAIITTSSEYAYDETDIQHIKKFLEKDFRNLIIHSRIDDNCGKGLELDLYICVCDFEFKYETNPTRIDKILEELFDYEMKPFCVDRSDFDRVINHCDLFRIAELTSQLGVNGLVEQLKIQREYCTIPTAQYAVFCIEYKKECNATYEELMKIIETIEGLMPHTLFVWGARENHTLPENGYKITILTDIPDDHYQLHLMCGIEEV